MCSLVAGSEGRHGAEWEYGEYVVVVDGLGAGLDVAGIGERLGRTPAAVRSVMRRLVPADLGYGGRKAEAWPREQIRAGGYPWLRHLRGWYGGAAPGVWTAADDAELRRAWQERTPMAEFLAASGFSELSVVRRLVKLGVAGDMAAIGERLGVAPGGFLELRQRLRESGMSVFVLLVDAEGRQRVSVHDSERGAVEALDGLDPTLRDTGGLRWAIVESPVSVWRAVRWRDQLG